MALDIMETTTTTTIISSDDAIPPPPPPPPCGRAHSILSLVGLSPRRQTKRVKRSLTAATTTTTTSSSASSLDSFDDDSVVSSPCHSPVTVPVAAAASCPHRKRRRSILKTSRHYVAKNSCCCGVTSTSTSTCTCSCASSPKRVQWKTSTATTTTPAAAAAAAAVESDSNVEGTTATVAVVDNGDEIIPLPPIEDCDRSNMWYSPTEMNTIRQHDHVLFRSELTCGYDANSTSTPPTVKMYLLECRHVYETMHRQMMRESQRQQQQLREEEEEEEKQQQQDENNGNFSSNNSHTNSTTTAAATTMPALKCWQLQSHPILEKGWKYFRGMESGRMAWRKARTKMILRTVLRAQYSCSCPEKLAALTANMTRTDRQWALQVGAVDEQQVLMSAAASTELEDDDFLEDDYEQYFDLPRPLNRPNNSKTPRASSTPLSTFSFSWLKMISSTGSS